MILAQWSIALVASLATSVDVTVSPARPDRPNATFHAALAALDRPSERTLETLRRYDLETRYRRDPANALMQLENTAKANQSTDVVYALAELCWIEGVRLDHRRKGEALDFYVDAVTYAYDLLFAPEIAAGLPASDPRYRMTINLYNGGLDRLIRAAQLSKDGKIEPDGVVRVKVHGKELAIRVTLDQAATPWKPADIQQLILCSDYEVGGLPTKARQYGLGVPLIAIRKSDRTGPGEEKFYPSEMAFPLTAFLKPVSRLRDAATNDARDCTLELVDPVRVPVVNTTPPMPIESDFSTPLAYMWAKTDLSKYRWSGLMRPEQNMDRAGLMLLRPYEPGKIPVVMVHGLASTPLAWIPMINELLHDPRIQDKYQFFLYLYPTGVPFPIAAAGLRETLVEAEGTFNPRGTDAAFSRMVLLGHSMGGLLSHAMVVKSEDKFWQLNVDAARFEDIIGPAEVRDELKRYLFFDPLPFVKRVVFLATPHRGSEMSRGVIGRVGAGLITDSDHIAKLLAQLVKSNPEAFDRRRFKRLPSSIETLETNGKMLLALLAMKPNPDVVLHSIIGSLRPGPRESTTDGVVPYASSHLDGVASELVVRSDHGVQRDLIAVQEVERILHEHLGEATRPVVNGGAGVATSTGSSILR